MMVGVKGSTSSRTKSSRTMTMVTPAGPMFFWPPGLFAMRADANAPMPLL